MNSTHDDNGDTILARITPCLENGKAAFVDYATKNMNGSSDRQRISAETIGQFRLPKFEIQDLIRFEEMVSPMFIKMRRNSLEHIRLAELFSILLPKLMSGEIELSHHC